MLTIMLNHAFVACDSIVVHLPTEHHNLISFGDNAAHQHNEHQTSHANEAVNDVDDPHEVSCTCAVFCRLYDKRSGGVRCSDHRPVFAC